MSSTIGAYGKLNLIDQPVLLARRQSRRRLIIIGLSSSTLVAIIVIAVLATRSSGGGPDPQQTNPDPSSSSSFSTSIKALCDATLYPNSCMDSLSHVPDSTGLDPAKLFNISVQVAIAELTKVATYFNETISKTMSQTYSLPLADCNELIALAIDHLEDCVASGIPADFSDEAFVDDVKTWLSSAITHQHTCIDAFENSTQIKNSLRNSTELASNSLAIFSNLYNVLGSLNLRRRRLMSYGTPSWMSPQDRRLLQSSTDPRSVADIVVAKDGTGKYKTIEAALKAVPAKSKKRTVIYVKRGVYFENVRVEKNKWNVMMVGDGKYLTVVSAAKNFVDGTPTFSTPTFGKGKKVVNLFRDGKFPCLKVFRHGKFRL